jgi:hypothetical protein
MVSVERLLLFLTRKSAEIRARGDKDSVARSADDGTRREFKAQKVQFLLDPTLGRINLLQNDIIKLFLGDRGHLHAPTVTASIYGMIQHDSRRCRRSIGTGAIPWRSR